MVDGHTVAVSVEFSASPAESDIRRRFENFRGLPQERKLPSAPPQPVIYMDEANRPQPRKDAERERGMAVFVGRLRECPVLDYKFVVLGHNTIRGAAGAAVLNAELMHSEGISTDDRHEVRRNLRRIRRRHRTGRRHRPQPRSEREPVVVVSAMGKTTNKLLAIANAAIEGERADSSSSCTTSATYHSREARLVVPLDKRAELDRTLDDHFQELTELVKGLAVLGELTPRSIDAISSYGERLSSYIVTLAFRHFGMKAVHVDSRKVIVTDNRHTQRRPDLPGDLRPADARPSPPWPKTPSS